MKYRLVHLFTFLALTQATSFVVAAENKPSGGHGSSGEGVEYQSRLARLPSHIQFMIVKSYMECQNKMRTTYSKMPENSKRDQWLETQLKACLTKRDQHVEIEIRNIEIQERQARQKNENHENDDKPDEPHNPDTKWTDNWFSRQTKVVAPIGDAAKRILEQTGHHLRMVDGGGSVGGGGTVRPINVLPRLRMVPLR
ncbi:MAG: hypothetical protein M1816_005799 [Peltula sp. TS41687]|nr:MAG: hypothetical protein M1816_005799 [Peltula sp. TS41687]